MYVSPDPQRVPHKRAAVPTHPDRSSGRLRCAAPPVTSRRSEARRRPATIRRPARCRRAAACRRSQSCRPCHPPLPSCRRTKSRRPLLRPAVECHTELRGCRHRTTPTRGSQQPTSSAPRARARPAHASDEGSPRAARRSRRRKTDTSFRFAERVAGTLGRGGALSLREEECARRESRASATPRFPDLLKKRQRGADATEQKGGRSGV